MKMSFSYKSILAVIFDLDGLLSDTETLHMHAYQKVLGRYSIKLSNAEYSEHWITHGLGITEYIDKYNLELVSSALKKEKAVIFDSLLKTSLKPMPYALEIVKVLYKKKKLAVASSSNRKNVDSILTILGIRKYFDVIVSESDVGRSKPFPDIFNLAAERLHTANENCIVLEDAQKGIIAANGAHMPVIAIPNQYTVANDFTTADFVCQSLEHAEKIILGW
jgi:HAD superfamily hydrolase (TIGR01509 family)